MMTDKPLVVEVGLDVLQQIQEQMRELTEQVGSLAEEVRDLKSLAAAANANRPAKPEVPQKKKPYVRMPGL